MPDGTSRFSIGKEQIHHYMGTSTFSSFTVLPEIAVAKIREDAPFDKVCYIGCGVTTGIGAVINTARGEARRQRGLRPRRHRAERDPGRPDGRRRHHRRRRHQPEAPRAGREVRHDPLRQPDRGGGDLVPYLVDLDPGRRRFQLRVHRQRQGDAPGARVLPQGLGDEHHHRRRGGRRGDRHTPFQLVTGRVWKGTAFGGAEGAPTFPRSSTGTWRARSRSTSSSPTRCRSTTSTTPSISCTKARSIRSVVLFS